MKRKNNQRKALAFILAFCCFGLTGLGAQGSGDACTVQISGGNFSGPTFVGNDNVTVVYIPKEDLLGVAEDLKKLEKERQEIIAKSKAADQLLKQAEARIKIAEQKERAAELAKEASRKEKEKSVRALSEIKKANQDFDSNKQKFMSEVQVVVDEIEAGISRRELENLKAENSAPIAELVKINKQIKEVEEKGMAIIRGLNCMANDHEVYEIKEANGSISFGFNVEDLKNDPNYTIVGELHEGRRMVKKFNVYGYMDKSGQPVITYQYDFADRFYNGKAIVQKNREWFFIDVNGKVVKEFGGINKLKHISGKTYVLQKSSKAHFLMDENGTILSPVFEEIQAFSGENLFRANTNKERCGLINRSGDFVLPAEYSSIGGLDKYGFAPMIKIYHNNYGIVNQKGKVIVKSGLQKPVSLSGKNGYTIYREGPRRRGIVHHEKGMILPAREREITKIIKNTFLLKQSDGLHGVFDVEQGMLLKEEFSEIKFSKFNNYCWAQVGWSLNWKLFDQDFQRIGGKKMYFRGYRDFNEQGFAFVKSGIFWGTINEQGKFLIKPDYEELYQSTPRGVYRFRKYSKWGLLNAKGREIHKPIYEQMSEFDAHGFSKVKQSNKYGILYKDGSFILPVEFESLQWLSDIKLIFAGPMEGEGQIFDFKGKEKGRIALPTCNNRKVEIIGRFDEQYHEIRACGLSNLMDKKNYQLQVGEFYKEKYEIQPGYYLIKTANDKWSLYNDKRQLVFGPYDEVAYLGDQYFKVRKKSWNTLGRKSEAGIVDLQGKVVVDFKYQTIFEYRNQLAIVQKGVLKDIGVVNLFGAEIIPPIFDEVKFTDLHQIEISCRYLSPNKELSVEKFIIDDKGNCLTNCEIYKELLRKYYKK